MTHQHVHRRGWRRILMTFLMLCGLILIPLSSAQANPMCPGNPAPLPESAGSGSDGLLVPPQSRSAIEGSPDGMPPDASMYGQYGTAGQQWHMITESCVDKMGLGAQATIANSAWDLSKTINQSTITVYQAATSDGLLASFTETVENVVVALREGIWRPLIPTIVILGAIWLGWYGLIRKRMTLTIESSVWMVAATALGMWILVNPSQVMGLGSTLVNSGTQLVTSAVGQVPYGGGSGACPAGAEPPERASWESEADFQVRRNADMMWSSLVCQPWTAGQFGSGEIAENAAMHHAGDLIAVQGISRIEQQQIADGDLEANALIAEKQESYEEIASSVESSYPSVYPLFSGDDQGSRLGVATLALFASLFAGGLILAGSVALIVLKIGFMLLFMLSPVFLLIGIHPGYGRMVLLRWVELMVGFLLKQIFVVLLIALLVMSYGMVMSTPLGWGLQMILLALFTLALFIYRKTFAYLFASVNANTFTSRIVTDAARSQALDKSAMVLPPVAYLKTQNWGRRHGAMIAGAAAGVPAGGGVSAGATETAEEVPESGGSTRAEGARVRGTAGYGRVRGNDNAPPLNVSRSGGPGSQRPTTGARSGDQAPSLSGNGGTGTGGGAGSGGPIPPRPAGGYTGTGDSGWAGVFGTGGGGNGPNRNDGAGSGTRSGGGVFGGGTSNSRAASADRAEPSTGRGIFNGREDTPAHGNLGRGSRWGGPKEKRERPAPQRPARPAPADRGRRGDGEGGWLTGSGKSKDNAPITPFWGEGGSSSTRDRKRDVPFWLNDD
ncbi:MULTISPECIES: type IV secretion system protein [unclassified Nocardiopsis]|uniref:type IV secretion system protein n=1 Tax=unclassified Nocardiopsis TaxID=2649073 RepID=UPI00066A797B|nr:MULTISPECIES: type IV secretion system protein [unclassified Nocardiopsis]MBQ1083548.1 conjugal transfer protein TrbL [Nocardiopsis sp. B62]